MSKTKLDDQVWCRCVSKGCFALLPDGKSLRRRTQKLHLQADEALKAVLDDPQSTITPLPEHARLSAAIVYGQDPQRAPEPERRSRAKRARTEAQGPVASSSTAPIASAASPPARSPPSDLIGPFDSDGRTHATHGQEGRSGDAIKEEDSEGEDEGDDAEGEEEEEETGQVSFIDRSRVLLLDPPGSEDVEEDELDSDDAKSLPDAVRTEEAAPDDDEELDELDDSDDYAHFFAPLLPPCDPGPMPSEPPLDEATSLSDAERHSLYCLRSTIASRGSGKAYRLHAADIKRATGLELLSFHLAKKLLARVTNWAPVFYEMCLRSCQAFTGPWKDDVKCSAVRDDVLCDEPRRRTNPRTNKEVPKRMFMYNPIIPRVEAMFRNTNTAPLLRSLSVMARETRARLAAVDANKATLEEVSCHDFGEGSAVVEYHEDFFGDDCDPRNGAFTISADGAQLTMKKKSSFWLIIIIIAGVPASAGRYTKAHLFRSCIIGGPNNLINLESFAYPFYLEMAQCANGIWMWDCMEKEWFVFRAVCLAMLGDMPGSAKWSGLVGQSGRSGCRHCLIIGIQPSWGSGASYFPLTNVLGPPHKKDATKLLNAGRPDYDVDDLPMRTHEDYGRQLLALEHAPPSKAAKLRTQYGISRPAESAHLPGFEHPRREPHDIAHLVFENIVPHFFGLQTGRYGTWKNKRLRHPDDRHWLLDRDCSQDDFKPMFDALAIDLPTALSPRTPRNPFEFANSQFRMWEWASFLFDLSIPIMIESGVDDDIVRHWSLLVEAIRLLDFAPGKKLTLGDISKLRELIGTFLVDFEKLYVRDEIDLIYRALFAIHALAHLPDDAEWHGNNFHFSQYPTERAVGETGRNVRSKKAPMTEAANQLATDEQMIRLELMREELGLDALEDRQVAKPKASGLRTRLAAKHLAKAEYFAEAKEAIRDWVDSSWIDEAMDTSGGEDEDGAAGAIRTETIEETLAGSHFFGTCTVSADLRIQSVFHEARKTSERRASRVVFESDGRKSYGEVLFFAKMTLPTGSTKEVAVLRLFEIVRTGPANTIGVKSSNEVVTVETSLLSDLIGLFTGKKAKWVIHRRGVVAWLQQEAQAERNEEEEEEDQLD